MTEPIIVEYLVIVDPKKGLACDIPGLRYLLEAHDKLTLSNGSISFEDSEVSFEVSTDEVVGDANLRFFHLILTVDEEQIVIFQSVLRAVRSVLSKAAEMPIQILRDGVGFYYAKLAYPQIHRIENLMRKLITKFMITRVGMGWTTVNVPREVTSAIRTNKNKRHHDLLWDTDFIQLANFLFKPYAQSDNSDLQVLLSSCTGESLPTSALAPFVSLSNWQRYFDELVACEGDYLEKRWIRLYELRCKIAHNNVITVKESDEITQLVNDLSEKLEEAVARLGEVEVRLEDREQLAEDAVSIHEITGQFIEAWRTLEKLILHISKKIDLKNERLVKRGARGNISGCVVVLRDQCYLPEELLKPLVELWQLRDLLVHHHDAEFDKARLKSEIARVEITVQAISEWFAEQ
ncbi:hypothetical protein Lepto7376_3747 [[Leptolyngbya] sp. PCC 7376]|uniref:HEPN domain-containing protein n=1 Tax=[Leptolyngbya] sp. PCC 7376 TaxID=111781 RepID=UPI00029F20C5|nr:HEPN domain-containing protein [[Leptolyngbya] sp. PCC 7376]AFY39921.1 hypothetical protein Lepto7376_3747 [[Leptolyngbya] sp. PCC 7376]